MDLITMALSQGYTNDKVATGYIMTNEQAKNINQITDAKKDFLGNIYETLDERIRSDVGFINDRFNNAQYLSYEGKYITAKDSYLGEVKDFIIKGNTLQNLFKLSDKSPTWITGTVPRLLISDICIDDNLCKASTYTFYNYTNKNIRCDIYTKSTKTYKTVFSIPIGISTQILSEDECFRNLSGRESDGWTNTANDINLIKQSVILLEGSQSYIPNNYFENIKLVEGNLNIKSCSKNLCDNNKNQLKNIRVDTGEEFNDNACIVSDYIKVYNKNVIASKVETSAIQGASVSYRIYDFNKNYIGSDISLLKPNYYIKLRCLGSNNSKFNIPQDISFQLEYGTTSTEIEEFKGSNYIISNNILLNAIGSTYDYINLQTKKLVKNIGIRDYKVGDELLSNIITDKIKTYYILSTPIISDISVSRLPITYDNVTNIYIETDNLIPTISCKIPSNVQAVVSTLSVENESLKSDIQNIKLNNLETSVDQEARLTALELKE